MCGKFLTLRCPECGQEFGVGLGIAPVYQDEDGNRYHKIISCEKCEEQLLLKIVTSRTSELTDGDYEPISEKKVGKLTQVGCICY